MVVWQRHLQSCVRQVIKRHEGSRNAPFSTFIQTKASLMSASLGRSLFAVSSKTPFSSPLISSRPASTGTGSTESHKAFSKPLKVQAVFKGIKQSPKKVNLVTSLVRGRLIKDALLPLQVTMKRVAKTVYQVIHSAWAIATQNHVLKGDRLVGNFNSEAPVWKGFFSKRISYHASKCGTKVSLEWRWTSVLREVPAAGKLTKRQQRLVPHKLIESTIISDRKSKRKGHGPVAVEK